MSEIFEKTVAMAILCAALGLILKNFGWRGAPVLTALCAVGAVSMFGEALSHMIGGARELLSVSGATEYVGAVIKIIGVCHIGHLTEDVCLELGESGAAKAVAYAARLEIAIISFPYFTEAVNIGMELIG